MFSARSAPEHSARKRLISNVYSKSYIQSSEAAAAQSEAILYERILPILEDSVAETDCPRGIDIYSVFMAATMDFIAAYLFGLKNGTNFLDDKGYRDHFFELYKVRNGNGDYDQELPQLTSLCRKLGIPLCPSWVDAANRELGEWCQRLCDKTEQFLAAGYPKSVNPSDEPIVWNALVGNLRNEEAKYGRASVLYPTALANFKLSVASELLDHVLAGQETAGLALTYLSWRLSYDLELQAKLRAELLTLSPNMRLVEGQTPQMPDPKQLDRLPLLHAVLMETLRLHAPIPGAQPRQTPDSGYQLGPYLVPGGVRVAALAYTLHRDETVFPDPEKWDHSRWLPSSGSEEERKQRNRMFWAFSSGGRMCIGSNFAMNGKLPIKTRLSFTAYTAFTEMKLIIAAIYSNHTSYIVDDEGMAEQSDGYTGRPKNEQLWLRFEKVA